MKKALNSYLTYLKTNYSNLCAHVCASELEFSIYWPLEGPLVTRYPNLSVKYNLLYRMLDCNLLFRCVLNVVIDPGSHKLFVLM